MFINQGCLSVFKSSLSMFKSSFKYGVGSFYVLRFFNINLNIIELQ